MCVLLRGGAGTIMLLQCLSWYTTNTYGNARKGKGPAEMCNGDDRIDAMQLETGNWDKKSGM